MPTGRPVSKKTPKKKLFVAHYLANGLNATKAAESAGYSKYTAKSQGHRLLTDDDVAKSLADKQGSRLAKLEITADRVLNELALMGFANMADYLSIDDQGRLCEFDYGSMTREQAAAIQEITIDTTGGSGDGERKLVLRTKFKLASKREALELLGKHLKLFTEKVELSGSVSLADAIAEARKRVAK